jgi:membrane fusion protein, multidrug efflux system
MKRSIIITAFSVFAIMLINQGCASRTESMAETNEQSSAKAIVKTALVGKRAIERTIEHTSTFTPFEEVHFSPASPGRIESLKVNVGDKVSRGALLAVMDQTQLNQARVQLSNLQTDFQRFDTLIKTGSIPQQQYDQIKTQYEVAKTNFEFLQRNTQLRAPFSGVISGKYYQEGEMYLGTPSAQIGKAALVSIVQINPIKAIVNVSERYFPTIHKGMKAEVACDIYPGENFPGEVIRIHPIVDQTTRTFQVEVKVQNPDEKLRPGMFARISIQLGLDQGLMVPAVAVMKQTGTNTRYVFIRNNDRAEMRHVTLGNVFNDYLEITSGIQEGDELVVVGQNKLSHMSEIEVVE